MFTSYKLLEIFQQISPLSATIYGTFKLIARYDQVQITNITYIKLQDLSHSEPREVSVHYACLQPGKSTEIHRKIPCTFLVFTW